jgi:hypothetical protein
MKRKHLQMRSAKDDSPSSPGRVRVNEFRMARPPAFEIVPRALLYCIDRGRTRDNYE